MAIVLRHYGIMKGRKIYIHNVPLYYKNADALEGKRIELSIKEVHEKPSTDQHAYYRGAVIETALTAECFRECTGDEVHKFLSDRYLGFTIIKSIGKYGMSEFRVVPSTADLTRKEMAEYVDRCIGFLAENGVVVHTADEYKLHKYKTRYDKQ